MQLYYCHTCGKLISPALVDSGEVKIEEEEQPVCIECSPPPAPAARSARLKSAAAARAGRSTPTGIAVRKARSAAIPTRGTPSRGTRISPPSPSPLPAPAEPPRLRTPSEPPRPRVPSGRSTGQQTNPVLVIGGAVVGVIVLVLLAVVMSSSSSPRPAPKKKVPTVSEPDKPVVRPDDTTQRDFRGPGFVTPPPKKKDTEPTSIKGRYVRIELPGKKRILSLAEVEVFCKEENIAPKGKATQSSTSGGGDPARANDGNKNGDWKNGSITHTNEEDNPWWELDLGGDHDIRKVVVHNRMDEKGKLAGRLKGFTLKILDKDRKVVWQKDKVPAPNPYYVLFPK